MLVVSRKRNESLVINDDITIVVVDIRGDKVRLGVEAPKEVPVHRNEVYEAIRRSMANDSRESYAAVADEENAPTHRDSPRPAAAAVLAPPATPRDGLCCPQCQSGDVRVERIKVAYKGAELVRWRACGACGNKFQTLERVEAL
jgi:carbon storage regulator